MSGFETHLSASLHVGGICVAKPWEIELLILKYFFFIFLFCISSKIFFLFPHTPVFLLPTFMLFVFK